MPYILIRGNLIPYVNNHNHRCEFCSIVSGLKADDIKQLNNFDCGGYSDDLSIVYTVHPCRILSALEILGFRVITSTSSNKSGHEEYIWTMRKEFDEPEPKSDSI